MVFDSKHLVMDVVVDGVVWEDLLEKVPWERVSTMVVDGFQCRKRVEEDRFSWSQIQGNGGNACAHRVQEKSFNRVVEQCAKSIWNIELVMA